MSLNPFVQTIPTPLYTNYDCAAVAWVAANRTDSRAPQIKQALATVPTALWVGPGQIGSWVGTHAQLAQAQGKMPVFVAYNIPDRDLGQYSSGGAASVVDYLTWAQGFSQGIAKSPAVLIVEPDSIIHLAGLTTPAQQNARLQCLTGIISAFTANAPNTTMYLDAGDGYYNKPETVAPWLIKAGLAQVRGFSVNVANYNTVATAAAFAKSLIQVLRGLGQTQDIGYVIDISRNGNGRPADAYIAAHADNWYCNWPGCKIGAAPQVVNTAGADALLWVKGPGVSDGTCGMTPSTPSGIFDPALALRLIAGK